MKTPIQRKFVTLAVVLLAIVSSTVAVARHEPVLGGVFGSSSIFTASAQLIPMSTMQEKPVPTQAARAGDQDGALSRANAPAMAAATAGQARVPPPAATSQLTSIALGHPTGQVSPEVAPLAGAPKAGTSAGSAGPTPTPAQLAQKPAPTATATTAPTLPAPTATATTSPTRPAPTATATTSPTLPAPTATATTSPTLPAPTATATTAPMLPAPTATATIAPTAPPPAGAVPVRIVANAIGLDTRIIPVGWREVTNRDGTKAAEWIVASYAVSWHQTSARLGQAGNTVLTGHNNIVGEVFRHLEDFKIGDPVTIYGGNQAFQYKVTEKFIVQEVGVPYAQRLENARWIEHFDDERVTLMSCWPYTGDSHRIFVILRPAR